MPEPPRGTIRRTTAILATSVLLLVVAGVPAWAGASIAPAEVEADTDAALTLRVTEPTDEEDPDYGDTARVDVRAPTGFTDIRCGQTLGWGCAVSENGTRVTFTRAVALGDTHDLQFTVHTSETNGTYEFRVTQADGPPAEEGEDPPTTIPSRPVVTVDNGKDPAPEPTPPADDGGSQDGGATDDNDTPTGDSGDGDSGDGDSGTPSQTGDDGPAASGSDQDTGTSGGDTSGETDDGGSTGGSTAPRRTQGRATGTTLEITPGEPTDDDPAIAPPAVADDPAVTAPSGTQRDGGSTSESTAAAATGAQPSAQPGDGAPWQQWVGAAMLLAGLATVGVRWFRERRAG